MKNGFQIVVLIIGLFLLVGSFAPKTAHAVGTIVVVNGFGDLNDLNPGDGVCDVIANFPGSYECSLRAAIEELNAQGSHPSGDPHRIEFNLTGIGPFTIAPTSTLPPIEVPVKILGYTQPGSSCPTATEPANLQIILDGGAAGMSGGLYFGGGSDGSTVRGLVIGNFELYGIALASNNNKVRCSHIGIAADGVSAVSNEIGIVVSGNDNIIGGFRWPRQRNVISGNAYHGLRIDGDANRLGRNYIGTTADGQSALGNGTGIFMMGALNEIGEAASNSFNVLSGNTAHGFSIDQGDANIVHGNYFGVAQDGLTPVPNGVVGLGIHGEAVGNVVGGVGENEGNLIAYNGGSGVSILNLNGTIPTQNSVRGNAIFENGDQGIALGTNGTDLNDLGDLDGDENEHQNYPLLYASVVSGIVDGTLLSEANVEYTVDVYRSDSCDNSGFGQGQEYLDSQLVLTDATGSVVFSFVLIGTTPGDNITATVTDPDGNTSEFSECVVIN